MQGMNETSDKDWRKLESTPTEPSAVAISGATGLLGVGELEVKQPLVGNPLKKDNLLIGIFEINEEVVDTTTEEV
jgi:hypothetical protein